MSRSRWPSAEERFSDRVNRDGPIPEHRPELGNCWLWTGPVGKHGYAPFQVNGVQCLAHWYAYERANGARSGHVMHLCDNRRCVRAEHLAIGTNADNVADKVEKGRAPRGNEHGYSIGKDMTVAAVKMMRLMYEDGVSAPQIARMTGRHYKTVLRALKHQRWLEVGF